MKDVRGGGLKEKQSKKGVTRMDKNRWEKKERECLVETRIGWGKNNGEERQKNKEDKIGREKLKIVTRNMWITSKEGEKQIIGRRNMKVILQGTNISWREKQRCGEY